MPTPVEFTKANAPEPMDSATEAANGDWTVAFSTPSRAHAQKIILAQFMAQPTTEPLSRKQYLGLSL